jgi:hypothetical protein
LVRVCEKGGRARFFFSRCVVACRGREHIPCGGQVMGEEWRVVSFCSCLLLCTVYCALCVMGEGCVCGGM